MEPAPPDLVISKTGPATATSGSPITHTLTITNNGTDVAFNPVITDMIPTYADYITGGIKIGNVVSWTVPNLLGSGVWTQSTFVVTATQTITNSDYRVRASGGYSATGSVDVVTIITDASIIGLSAVNDSSTTLGQVTMLTATVTAGSNVTYTWAFGDGATSTGDVITHTYPAAGVYTAIVTAGNSAGVVTATITVTIVDEAIVGLSAINNSPTALGQVTTLTATITTGSNVTYTWAFGDGTTGSGAVVEHTYSWADSYTVVVTASNSANLLTQTTIVNVTNPADLALTKTVDDSTPDQGQTITYTIVVSNNGLQAATGVIISDVLPAGLTFSSTTASQGVYTHK